jgi:hypothetical protein
MGVHVKVAGAWQEIGVSAGSGGIPWAKVSGGTVTTVTNPDGSVDTVHTFTANGTLTVDEPGYARVLLVGRGGYSIGSAGIGNGARIREGIYSLPAGSHAVVPGADLGGTVAPAATLGPLSTGTTGTPRNTSDMTGAGTGTNQAYQSDISGTVQDYAPYGDLSKPGGGGRINVNEYGTPGIVIVRVRTTPAPPPPTTQEGWAKVTGGTVTEYTKPDGAVMEVHTFTANGSLTVDSPGYAEVLLVGGGGGGTSAQFSGGAGRIVHGLHPLQVGTQAVTVGAAGASGLSASAYPASGWGKSSGLGSLVTGKSGPWGTCSPNPATTEATGFTSSITGTAVEYARVDDSATTPGSATGTGATTSKAGVVIVAVQKSAPTISGVAATGGTVTEYTGNGVNGVNGQKYKVHTFATPGAGSLVVSQGGDVDVLICGAGGNPGSGYGNGAHIITCSIPLTPSTVPVVVAPGNTGIGGRSGLGGLFAAGGWQSPATSGCGIGAGMYGSSTVAEMTAGVRSSITGTEVEYCKGGTPSPGGDTPGSGGGQGGGSGAAGVVIVRYTVA